MSSINPRYYGFSTSLADYSSNSTEESDTSLADSESELDSNLETTLQAQNSCNRLSIIQKTIERLLDQGKLQQAAAIGRTAGLSQGFFLELVAMKYIEQGDLITALKIGREIPTDLQNRIFRGNIERAVAKKYIERGDLECARQIAITSIFTARDAILTLIIQSETNGEELPSERLMLMTMLS